MATGKWSLDSQSDVQVRLMQLLGASSLLTVLCLASITECRSAPYHYSIQAHRHSEWHKYRLIDSAKPTFTGEITLGEAVTMGLAADSDRRRHAVTEQLPPFRSELCRSPSQSGLSASYLCTDAQLADFPTSLAAYAAHCNTVALAVRSAYWEAIWHKANLELVSEKLQDREETFAGFEERVPDRAFGSSHSDKSRKKAELVGVEARKQVADASCSFRASLGSVAKIGRKI
ncbi:MAG: hypothetical protein K2X27_18035 [Candidatus Obscuribacterales bacterium]|nr:hypothetical protein [Candidatus Obscuribacterales bacterium]